ncbi:hypothetical protein GCM10023115_38920 [Pontixanthobacter gangjinensis]
MCSISDKIKFCSCARGEKRKLKNFWVLYRYQGEKLETFMGEPKVPTKFLDPDFFMNAAIISERLNEVDAFDVPLNFREKDKLLVEINCCDQEYTYTFEYMNETWESAEEDVFDIMNHFKKINKGRLKDALKPNKA